MSNSSTRTSDRVLAIASPFHRSISPSGQSYFSSPANYSSQLPSSGEFHHPTSPTRVNRSSSRKDSISSPPRDHMVKKQSSNINSRLSSHLSNLENKRCMCSPTMHQGSFRCGLHKNSHSISYTPNRLVRRALASPSRPPSSHQQRRRVGFEMRPSRLSVMSKADDDL